MKTIYILLLFIFATSLNAVAVKSDKNIYSLTDNTVTIHFEGMEALNKDWIGIYPKGKNTDWKNVVQWKWTGDKSSGNALFKNLPKGNYSVRVFYNNSFKTEASYSFNIGNSTSPKAKVTTNKKIYATTEGVIVNFEGMKAHRDWIGIYPKTTSNSWSNVVQWAWTDDVKKGTHTFTNLPVGEYEARVFFDNSYKTEDSYGFKVLKDVQTKVTLTPNKTTYNLNEDVTINFTNMQGNAKDWLAIYPVGSSNAWKNVIGWKWTGGKKNGQVTFTNNHVPIGEYEVRVFFNNSFKDEARKTFRITSNFDKQKLIQQAKEHCLNEDNSTKYVLCSNEENIVYLLTLDRKETTNYHKHYRVSIAPSQENVTIVNEYEHFLDWEDTFQNFQTKLENTPIYVTYNWINGVDHNAYVSFYYKDKHLKSFSNHNDLRYAPNDIAHNIKTFDNGKKLSLEYDDVNANPHGMNFTEIYDISNPSEFKLIKTIKKDITP